MESTAYDWSCFTKRIGVQASVPQVYRAFTTQKGLESWFLRLAEYTMPDGLQRDAESHTQVGDAHRWLWHGWCDDVQETGNTLEANGHDCYRFSFGRSGNVTVKLYTEEGETVVELKQEQIPTDEYGKQHYHLGCMEGWTFYLTNLKSVLQGGIDLRNRNERLQKVINS